jgi:hypothetical protein
MKPMWAIAFALLFASSADAADLRCARDHYRQLSTGKCLAKDSALGRRYYRGGKRHRTGRHARWHREAPPIPADPGPATAPVADPQPAPADPFPARFYYGKSDRLPIGNVNGR